MAPNCLRVARGAGGWIRLVIGCGWLIGAGCLAADPGRGIGPGGREAAFYVDNHGWHSGIIVPRAAIPPGAWPPGVVERDFAGCAYLELGWGDRKFYPAKHPTVGMALGAALVPGPSVLHIAGFVPPLASAHPWSSLVAVPCTPEELAGLYRDLGRSFETDARGNVARMGPGLYGRRSGFYPARGRYWIGNTCNTWTAREMRAGGLGAHTDVFEALTSGEVVGQARRLVGRRFKLQEPVIIYLTHTPLDGRLFACHRKVAPKICLKPSAISRTRR